MARRSTPNVSKAAADFIAYNYGKGGSAGVRYSQQSLLRRFARSVNDCQAGTLTPEHLETFFYGPGGLAETCARSTMGKYHGDLKAFLSWAHRRSWCDDPARLLGGITHTSTRVRRNRLRLSESQMWAMVQAAPTPRDAAMLVVAMHTGCRVSEILDIRLRDVNLETAELGLRIIKTHEEDVMRIAPTLDRYLREWLTAYHEYAQPASSDYLFPAARRPAFVEGFVADWQERGFNPDRKINNPATIVRDMAARAGVELESGDGWHTVRRSVARLFFDKSSHRGHDAALRMTAAFLHHKNTSTTEIYLGLELEKAKRDLIMAEGFLSDPTEVENVRSLNEYREREHG